MNRRQHTEIVAVLIKMGRKDLVPHLPYVAIAKNIKDMTDDELERELMASSKVIGDALKSARENLQSKIAEAQEDLNDLDDIWKSHDFDEAVRRGFAPKPALKQYSDIEKELMHRGRL